MRKTPYYFEVKDMITHFMSAFDDIFIKRYDNNREEVSGFNVRYQYGPKHRVVHDLINKSQHFTLPVVGVQLAGMNRDPNRVFNKITGSYHSSVTQDEDGNDRVLTGYLPQPVPVNLQLRVSIMTKSQEDMDQINSNFIAYTDPYIFFSWPVPSVFGGEIQEIRSQVLWDGNLNISYPVEINATMPYRMSADANFTIKGWIFRDKIAPAGEIHQVKANFTPVIEIEGLNDDLDNTNSVSLES